VAHKLTLEVESQQKLLQAEGGELVAQVRAVAPEQILDQLLEDLGPGLSSRVIREPVLAGAPTLRTDPAILCRVLGNMVKNALEALPPGGQARIWLEWRQGRPAFVVQNPGCIPPEIADRIFHRSFSTKASSGRGLGTYEMKVLGETVLGGKVGFTTNWEEGTRFFVELPAGV
jgi:sensor histidine kinase regulating citrate/malate metabolism